MLFSFSVKVFGEQLRGEQQCFYTHTERESEKESASTLTFENKSKQPKRLMTQYTSGRRGPFPLG